jgi:hypothetical protein
MTEHQHLEGQFMANGFLVKLYNEWIGKKGFKGPRKQGFE